MQLLVPLLLSVVPYPTAATTVMEALSSRLDVITFTNFMRSSHLDTVLNKGHHMVLVPTDAAFNSFPDIYLDLLHDQTLNKEHYLPDLLKYHIVPYSGKRNTHWTGEKVKTLLNKPVRIVTYAMSKKTIVDGVVMNDSHVTTSNGHIYLLDGVLSPPGDNIFKTLLAEEKFSTFLSAVTLAGMRAKVNEDNVTVLAPTNEAFARIDPHKMNLLFNNHADLQTFVQFHILQGIYFTEGLVPGQHLRVSYSHKLYVNIHFSSQGRGNLHINPGSVPVSQPDWMATNGVIHAVEHVILPNNHGLDWL